MVGFSFKLKKNLKTSKLGSPQYFSPEVFRDNSYSTQADVWAIGCVLYHLASLAPPFQGANL